MTAAGWMSKALRAAVTLRATTRGSKEVPDLVEHSVVEQWERWSARRR
jgi:hypothetical protein